MYFNINAHQDYIVDTSCTKLKYLSGKQTCNDIEKRDKILVDTAVEKYIEGLTKAPVLDNTIGSSSPYLLLSACVYKYQDKYNHYDKNGELYKVLGEYHDENQYGQPSVVHTNAKKYSWKLTEYHNELCKKTLEKYGYTAISIANPPTLFDVSDAAKKKKELNTLRANRQEIDRKAQIIANEKAAAAAAKQTAANDSKISECKAFLISKRYTVSDAPTGGRRRKTNKRTGRRNTRRRQYNA